MGLEIGGVDYSPYLSKGTLKHVSTLGADPDSLDFQLIAGSPKPPVGADVIFTLPEGNRLFGGVLMEPPEGKAGYQVLDYKPICSDWRHRADAKILNDRPVNKTAGQIVVELFAKYAKEFDTSLVDLGGPVIRSIRFELGSRLTQALEDLAAYTGYVWDITPDKQVIWQPAGTLPAPMELSDASRNFEDLTVSVSVEEVKNRIRVVGGFFPHPTPVVDTWTAIANQLSYRLTETPISLDQYVAFEDNFNGIDPTKWQQADVNNPTPPAGHIPSDGYLFTTLQQGAALAESGWLQVVGGNSVWGAVRLQSYLPIARGDGGRRFELDVYATTAVGQGRMGLWDPNNTTALAGEAIGFFFDAGTIKPSIGGVAQAPLVAVNYTAGKTVRLRIVPKAAGGATLWVNADDTGNTGLPIDQRVAWRPSQWVKLYETAAGALANLAFVPIFNHSFNGRVRRAKVFNRVYGATLTVGGAEKVVGLLNVDEDSGCDAVMGVRNGVPILSFFGDTAPAANAAIALTYSKPVPVDIRLQDDGAIALMKAIENPTNDPNGSDGIKDGFIRDPSLNTIELATQAARQELEQYANPPVTINYRTRVRGLRAGQVVPANLTQALSKRDLVGSFLIRQVETVSLGDSESYEASVSAGSRLKGLADYLRELQKAGRVLDDPSDENEAITEIIFASDTLTFTDAGSVSSPDVSAEDTLTFTDLGSVVEGPNGPFTYGSAQYGLSAYE